VTWFEMRGLVLGLARGLVVRLLASRDDVMGCGLSNKARDEVVNIKAYLCDCALSPLAKVHGKPNLTIRV
jgi:hypothetical protein